MDSAFGVDHGEISKALRVGKLTRLSGVHAKPKLPGPNDVPRWTGNPSVADRTPIKGPGDPSWTELKRTSK